MIRIFQIFTLYECNILASEASQKKYTNKVNTTLRLLLLHCPTHQTSTQDSISDKSQEGSRPRVPFPWIRSLAHVFSVYLCMLYTYHRHTTRDSRRDNTPYTFMYKADSGIHACHSNPQLLIMCLYFSENLLQQSWHFTFCWHSMLTRC